MYMQFASAFITRKVAVCLFTLAISFFLIYHVTNISSAQTPSTYYVDCDTGSDTNAGTSPEAAWKNISQVNNSNFNPGDSILFKRGCTFVGTLVADQQGTASTPITYGAYETGVDPLIQPNANGNCSVTAINISGNYQIIEHIRTTPTNLNRDIFKCPVNSLPPAGFTCTDDSGQNPQVGWYVGFQVGGDFNTVQDSEAYGFSIGVSTLDSSNNNKLLRNHMHDNNSFTRIYHSGGSMGAMGVLLHGNDSEYAYNLFENNRANCTSSSEGKTYGYSAPFELYNANRNHVHHNQAVGHVKHFEMGREVSDPNSSADDNILAYNLFVSSREKAKGPNIHGTTAAFGPVNRTKVYNNTIVFTGKNSEGIVASGPDTVVKNNIFIADGRVEVNETTGEETYTNKVAYFCGPTLITHSNNLFYRFPDARSTSPGRVQVRLIEGGSCSYQNPGATSTIGDPLFEQVTAPNVSLADDFTIQATSFARNAGINEILSLTLNNIAMTTSLNNVALPNENTVDIGAFEYSVDPTPTPTSPVSTPTPTLTTRPAPPTVTLDANTCVPPEGESNGTFITFDWVNSPRTITTVEVSTTSNYQTKYTDFIQNSTATNPVSSTGPSGFTLHGSGGSTPFTVLPDTQYFVRVWDGTTNSTSRTFTIPLCSGSALPGDFSNDCSVNVVDLSILLAKFGTSDSSIDLTGDGIVNVSDMSRFLSLFGTACL